jgi:hypothetical protein
MVACQTKKFGAIVHRRATFSELQRERGSCGGEGKPKRLRTEQRNGLEVELEARRWKIILEWTQERERPLCEKICGRLTQDGREKGRRERGSAPIFVVEEAHVLILHRQLSLKDLARRS